MGPATPLVYTIKVFCLFLGLLFGFGNVTDKAFWVFSWLGLAMTLRSSVALKVLAPYSLLVSVLVFLLFLPPRGSGWHRRNDLCF